MSLSFGFMIGAVILTVIGNLVILRYLLTRPLEPIFEEPVVNPPASPTAS